MTLLTKPLLSDVDMIKEKSVKAYLAFCSKSQDSAQSSSKF